MNRGKYLVQLANQMQVGDRKIINVCTEGKRHSLRLIKSDLKVSDSSRIDASESSFQDFESSGSEYLPSHFESKSENSMVIPLIKPIEVSEESLDARISRYLDSVQSTSSITKVIFKKDTEIKEFTTENAEEINLQSLGGKISTIVTDNRIEIPSTSGAFQNNLIKKPWARERMTICPICFEDVDTHFVRHLMRHHPEDEQVMALKSMKPRSTDRLSLVASLRKQGYFHLKSQRNMSVPMRTSKIPDAEYFVCTYCLGQYTKKTLYKHVKICNSKPTGENGAGKKCLSKSQTFTLLTSRNNDLLRTSRLKDEVFNTMRADNISQEAKSDPLICLYGETLLQKHKRKQISIVVSNKIREMARLLIAIKKIDLGISGLFYTLKPEMFQLLVSATKIISGYDEVKKSFKASSLALHMGTNLKLICSIALKIVIEKRKIQNLSWTDREQKKTEIKELRKLIVEHWCSAVSSLALKDLNEKHWEKPTILPLSSDIQAFHSYVEKLANDAYNSLNNNIDIETNYRLLSECVLAHTVIFNRKRVGDVQYLKIELYNAQNRNVNPEAFFECLTKVEQIISKKFKRVVTGGKGSKPVPILFSKQTQKFISCLLDIRNSTDIVAKSNPYLFASLQSQDRWMSGVNVIRKLAINCGAKNPSLLTSTKFRKHIATTLQLLTMGEDEIEQLATFMGHTKKTHSEFYRLPQDIYQTAKVAKILLLLEKGKGKEFKGKSLNDIELDDEVDDSTSEESFTPKTNIPVSGGLKNNQSVTIDNIVSKNNNENANGNASLLREKDGGMENTRKIKIKGRVKWSSEEKEIVLKHFRFHIKNRIAPKKQECQELIVKNKSIFKSKDWIRVKTLVYNTYKNCKITV